MTEAPARWAWLLCRVRSIPSGLVEAIWITLTMRVALSMFSWYISAEQPMWAPCHFEEAHNGWTFMPPLYREGVDFKAFGIWERWDACWYAKIAAFGYIPGPDGDETAFFPLFPMLMRTFSVVTGDNVVIAGMVVSTVAFLFAAWGLHELITRDAGEAVARRAVLYLAVFPTALFFFAPYTESLFLALSVWSIVLARRGSWALAGMLALLTGLTRPVGVFLAVPLAWLAFTAWTRSGARTFPIIGALAPLAGLGIFTLYSLQITGETPFDAQRRWWGSPELLPPWELIEASLDWIRRTGSPLQVLNLVVLIAAFVGVIFAARRFPPEYALFALPHVLLAGTRILPTPLTSTTRYLMLAFPLFAVLALAGEHRRAHVAWLILSLLFLGLLAHGYLRGDFVAQAGGPLLAAVSDATSHRYSTH